MSSPVFERKVLPSGNKAVVVKVQFEETADEGWSVLESKVARALRRMHDRP